MAHGVTATQVRLLTFIPYVLTDRRSREKGKRSVMMVALRLLHNLGFRTLDLIGADFKMSSELD